VPLRTNLLLTAELVILRLQVEVLALLRADGTDLRIVSAKLSLRVEDRVDVQTRGGRAASELAEAEDKLLLQIVGEVILGPEEDDSALRDLSHVMLIRRPLLISLV
jgi:hypothetical protein